MSKSWSPFLEIREGHHIIDGGVYKYICHPMYSAIWLWTLVRLLVADTGASLLVADTGASLLVADIGASLLVAQLGSRIFVYRWFWLALFFAGGQRRSYDANPIWRSIHGLQTKNQTFNSIHLII